VWLAALTGIAAGLIASGLATPWAPWAGLAIGPATALVVLARRVRLLLTLPAVGLVIAAGVYVAVGQAEHHYPAGAAWPSEFQAAALMCSLAVLLIGADALAERVRAGRTSAQPGPPEPAGSRLRSPPS
jgi:hypothetical protein